MPSYNISLKEINANIPTKKPIMIETTILIELQCLKELEYVKKAKKIFVLLALPTPLEHPFLFNFTHNSIIF
ncbi:MAG: hypothetical protein ACFFB6_12115 [Promethearchaeota archaeon]